MAGIGDRGTSPHGARQLSALLPNGRTIWLRVDTPLAPASSVDRLAQLAENVAERRESTNAALADAIERLSKTVDRDVERLGEARVTRARQIRRRLAADDNKLDARLAKVREEFQSRLDKQLKIDRENLRRLRRRDLWDKILIASSLPLFAAYGQRGSPFATNNLTLTLSLLIWLVGDQVVEAVFGSSKPNEPYALDDADAWSYLAPVGNVLAAWWLLSDRQHERFVTGIDTIKLDNPRPHGPSGAPFYRFRKEVELKDLIKKDHFPDFATFTGVPAVATVRTMRFKPESTPLDLRIETVTVNADAGVLSLSLRVVPRNPPSGPLPSSLGEIDVAWMVDTNKPLPPESTK